MVGLDHYLQHYEDFIILGDFNENEHNPKMQYFFNQQECRNIMKKKSCSKSLEGLCTCLTITSMPNLHQHTQVFELGMSDHYLMIYTMLKSTYTKLEPTVLR